MASEQHDAVFPEEELDDDDESQEYEEELEEEMDDDDDDVLAEDEENEPSPSTSSALAVTVAVPGSVITPISTTTATTIVVADSPDPKRQRVDQMIEDKKPSDDSRRLFQRLWTDEDEIELLQGFLDYTSQRGSSHHNDTALFYDQIKSKLQLDFNKNQLVEKIRRLKKKYRNVLNKIGSGKEFSFKSPHDQATFEISRKIWSNVAPVAVEDNNNIIALEDDEINLNPNPNPNFSPLVPKIEVNSSEKKNRKRSRPRSSGIRSNDGFASNKDHNCISNANAAAAAAAAAAATTTTIMANTNNNCNNSGNSSRAGLIEETVRSCLSPLLKELVGGAIGGPLWGRGFSLNPVMPLMNLGFGGGELVDEKWRKQQILELEVYSKRLELVQDQIKAAMEELRSAGGGGGGGGGG